MVRYTAPCGTSHEILLGTQRIFLFLDRGTKTPTGDATVTYESSESAKNAIDKFDQMDFNGHGIISVKQALPDQKNPFAEKLVSWRVERKVGVSQVFGKFLKNILAATARSEFGLVYI